MNHGTCYEECCKFANFKRRQLSPHFPSTCFSFYLCCFVLFCFCSSSRPVHLVHGPPACRNCRCEWTWMLMDTCTVRCRWRTLRMWIRTPFITSPTTVTCTAPRVARSSWTRSCINAIRTALITPVSLVQVIYIIDYIYAENKRTKSLNETDTDMLTESHTCKKFILSLFNKIIDSTNKRLCCTIHSCKITLSCNFTVLRLNYNRTTHFLYWEC